MVSFKHIYRVYPEWAQDRRGLEKGVTGDGNDDGPGGGTRRVIGDRKKWLQQVTAQWAEAEICPRPSSRPWWGSRPWSPRPRRTRPPASQTRSGLYSRYPYIDTQPCYSLINSRLLTKKALKISLFSLNQTDRWKVESIPLCWNLWVYNVQRKWIFYTLASVNSIF